MKKFLPLAIGVVLAAGCATTPESVVSAGRMQNEALLVLRDNNESTIDHYTQEVKDLTARQYNAELKAAEAKLVDRNGGTGMVPLDQYKQLVSLYAFEVARAQAYYDTKAAEYKLHSAVQYETAIRLHDAIQRYNEEAGVDPATFQALLDASADALTEVLTAYQAQKELEDAEAADRIDWREVLNAFNQKLFGAAMNRADTFDPEVTFAELLNRLREFDINDLPFELPPGIIPAPADVPTPTEEPAPADNE